jgi:oligopeptide transport system substrate-binding protein
VRDRRLRMLVGIVAACAALTACSTSSGGPSEAITAGPTTLPPPATPASPGGGSLRYGLGSDPASIDPRSVSDEQGLLVVGALFDPLVALDDDLEVVPAAARAWDVSDDGTRFTFRLRPDARFHDGTRVRAQDFVRAFNRIADGTADQPSFNAYLLAPVVGFDAALTEGRPLRGVQAVNAMTLRIRVADPFPEFVEVLANPALAPVPRAADTDPAGFAQEPIGNGRFQMAEPWQREQFIRLSGYADHHAGPPRLDEVVFRVYVADPAQESQYADLVAGQLQVADVPAARRGEAIEEFGTSVDGYSGPGVLDGLSTTIYYFGFNTGQPPFDDPNVRRAVSLLIDRDTIAGTIMQDTRVPADAIVPPPIEGHQEGVCGHCRFDPDAAAELLADVPPRALRGVTIVHNQGESHAAIASRIAQAIGEATGVRVRTRGVPLGGYVESLREGEVGLFRLGWQADYPSPGSYLFPLFHGSSVGLDNLTRYDVADVNDLLEQARAEPDVAARNELWQQAEQRILADAAIAPVLFYRLDKVVRPNVRDLVMDPFGGVDLARVWLDG